MKKNKLYYGKKSDFLYLKKSFNGAIYYTPIVSKSLLVDRHLWNKKDNCFVDCLIYRKTSVNCEWFIEDNSITELEDYPLYQSTNLGDIFGTSFSCNNPELDAFYSEGNTDYVYVGSMITEHGKSQIETLKTNNK